MELLTLQKQFCAMTTEEEIICFLEVGHALLSIVLIHSDYSMMLVGPGSSQDRVSVT